MPWGRPAMRMDTDPNQCLFCHEDVAATSEAPVHLAFMAHVERCPPCEADFDAWRTNMDRDFLGT